MKRGERLAVYGVCAVAVVCSLRVAMFDSPAIAVSVQGGASPAAATVATCDAMAVTEALYAVEPYTGVRKAEEERLKTRLMPMETELTALQTELKDADMSKPETQAKSEAFQGKIQAYNQMRQELSDAYDGFVAKQFAEAYERVQAAAGQVAKDHGFTHVIAHKSDAMRVATTQNLIADLISRPMLVMPTGSDITAKVREHLKLPEATKNSEAANPAAAPAEAPKQP